MASIAALPHYTHMNSQASAQTGSTTSPISAPIRSAATSQASTDTGNSGASTISSNDFLTLLVTELKNQDPTSNSDPNQYVNQLVQVNSLQQLIQINQTLSGTAASGSATGQGNAVTASTGTPLLAQPSVSTLSPAAPDSASGGNLSIPANNPAARRVAQALGSNIARTY